MLRLEFRPDVAGQVVWAFLLLLLSGLPGFNSARVVIFNSFQSSVLCFFLHNGVVLTMTLLLLYKELIQGI